MPGPNGAEMPSIKSCDLIELEPFGYREDRGIDGSEREIRVLPDQFRHPHQVDSGELHELDLAISDRVQEPGFGCGTNTGLQEVADLGEYGAGYEYWARVPLEEI